MDGFLQSATWYSQDFDLSPMKLGIIGTYSVDSIVLSDKLMEEAFEKLKTPRYSYTTGFMNCSGCSDLYLSPLGVMISTLSSQVGNQRGLELFHYDDGNAVINEARRLGLPVKELNRLMRLSRPRRR